MLLLTTDQLPNGLHIEQAFNMVMLTYPIEISKKNPLVQMFSKERDPHAEMMSGLMAQAPREANAIIGIQQSSSAATFSNGTFLYTTLTGTPVRLVEKQG